MLPRRAAALLLACALLTACGDALGVRPRPGDEPPRGSEPADGQLLWYDIDPRVLTPNGTGQVRITAKFTSAVSARVVLRNSLYPFEQIGSTWQAIVPEAELLEAYRAGDLHHVAGRIEVGTTPTEYTIVVNVAPSGLQPVAISSLGSGVKASPRVLNLRSDSIYGGRNVPPQIVKDVYHYLGDQYDFLLIVEAVRSANNRFFLGTRNQVSGLGLIQFDQGRVYGSIAQLQGIVHFPSDDFFDLAETGTLHELAHRWINHTRGPLLPGAPHFPISDLAYGIMGRSNPTNTKQSLSFPYQLEPQSNGNFIARRATPATEFNDFELYLMGLLPADSVRPHIVFRNQAQTAQVRPDGNLQGPVDTVRVSDVIAQEGARSPAYPSAPRVFTVATVVLSRGRLLTNAELAFFDHMTLRGEALTTLPYQAGLLRGDTKPFFVATGGRGRLQTSLRF
jgi:hypothetical protein